MAESFYDTIIRPALFPVVVMAIFLKILYLFPDNSSLGAGLAWFFIAFLVLYFVLLFLFMENTRRLWALRLKIGTLILIVFTLFSVIQVYSSPQPSTDVVIKKNAIYLQNSIAFLVAAIVFLILALIVEYTRRRIRQDGSPPGTTDSQTR